MFVAIDFETADAKRDSACAVGLVRVEGGAVVARETRLIRPPREQVQFTEIHGLRWADLKGQPPFAAVWPTVAGLLDGADCLVAHNASFDRSVLTACCQAAGIPVPTLRWVCTCELAKERWPRPHSNKLPDVCRRLGVELRAHHEAGADALAAAQVLLALRAEPPARPGAEVRRPPADPHPTLTALAREGLVDPADVARWVAAWEAERRELVQRFCACGVPIYWFSKICRDCLEKEEGERE